MNGSIRRPRFGRFIGTGVVLGFLAAVILGQLGRATTQYSGGAVVLYLGLLLGLVGGLAGGVVAILLDRNAERTARRDAASRAGGGTGA